MTPEEIAVRLRGTPPLHSRVHHVFLPLSIRQNKVEDIFLDLLSWLIPTSAEARETQNYSADSASELLMDRIIADPDDFRVTEDGRKRDLILRWIKTDIVVHSRHTNKTSENAVSIVPLHSAVANYFDPPGGTPNYGKFLCELLTRSGEELDFELLVRLAEILGSAGNDIVALLLQEALEQDPQTGQPRFLTLRQDGSERSVWSTLHARAFQEQVRSVLALSEVISRRTFISWLYSIVTFFVSTYFLRTSKAADAYADWISQVFAGDRSEWTLSLDDQSFAPRIPYGCRDETHSRLFKRFPGRTSEINIAQSFAEYAGVGVPARGDLRAAGNAIITALEQVDGNAVFRLLSETYPTKDERGPWKLSNEEREEILGLTGIQPFALAASVLNFEDMSRRSNNVMEWQFYSRLARHEDYGFALGEKGAVLEYKMSEPLLIALSHCHMEQSRSIATLGSLLTYLSNLGFAFDAKGRSELMHQLQGVGMLEDLSDASDAKYLRPIYPVEGAQ